MSREFSQDLLAHKGRREEVAREQALKRRKRDAEPRKKESAVAIDDATMFDFGG
jgi:hypothetical protein